MAGGARSDSEAVLVTSHWQVQCQLQCHGPGSEDLEEQDRLSAAGCGLGGPAAGPGGQSLGLAA